MKIAKCVCGELPEVGHSEDVPSDWYVTCINVGCWAGPDAESVSEAIEAWNAIMKRVGKKKLWEAINSLTAQLARVETGVNILLQRGAAVPTIGPWTLTYKSDNTDAPVVEPMKLEWDPDVTVCIPSVFGIVKEPKEEEDGE